MGCGWLLGPGDRELGSEALSPQCLEVSRELTKQLALALEREPEHPAER